MDTSEAVRSGIVALLSHYFGERFGCTYDDGYGEETLPIYIHNAYLLLIDHIGRPKAKQEIDIILTKNSRVALNYE